jgi:hypothetical protein
LDKEEMKMPWHEEKEPSSLVKWSIALGPMRLHMLLSSSFNGHHSFLFIQLYLHLGPTKWVRREKEIDNAEGLKAFAARKARWLGEYDKVLEKREEDKGLVDSER